MGTPQEPSLSLLSLAANKLKHCNDGQYNRRNCFDQLHTASSLLKYPVLGHRASRLTARKPFGGRSKPQIYRTPASFRIITRSCFRPVFSVPLQKINLSTVSY
jgi:hypothetical protein